MKKLIPILLAIFLSMTILNSHAQNLVPNSSFENFVACPPNLTYLYYSQPWFQPSTYYGTTTTTCSSDFFSNCAASSTSSPGVPVNYLGTQSAKTGTCYAGFFAYVDTVDSREYIETSLSQSLIAGEHYCVNFYVSLAENSDVAISNIGIYFSQDSLLDTTYHAISYIVPQIENPLTNILNNKTNWMPISGNYAAVGGETFITIGNFHTPETTNHQPVTGGLSWSRAYYYIDDISVSICDSSGTGIQENKNDMSFNLFPNPNNGNMTLNYTLASNEKATIIIYDVTGKTMVHYELNNASDKLEINASQLNNGIYFYHIVINNKIVKSDKLVIIK